MTVESSVSRVQYATAGVIGPWPVDFYFLANADLTVIYTNAPGVDTQLVLDADYSVAGAGNPNGGSITTTVAYAAGGFITVFRSMEATQETLYVDNDSFPAASINFALDKLTLLIQQAFNAVSRAISFPESYSGETEVGDVATRANKLLGFNNLGNMVFAGPISGSATELALELAGTGGAAQIGTADAADVFTGSTVEAALQQLGKDLRGRLRDVRTFAGIVADGVTDDFVAYQAAVVTARDSGHGIYFPKGVKVFVQFSTTHPYLFVDGLHHWEGADRSTCGLIVHCNYEMTGHAPLFCWGIPNKGVTDPNKVTGYVRNIGFWVKAGCQRFERLCHIYGAKDFTVEDCFADMTAVTWPAADGGHPSGYQAGGWWSSNIQPTFCTNQTRDENLRFIRNVGYASAEYQNAESIGITNAYGVEYVGNRLEGWADDMALHQCTDFRVHGNHMKAVAGRFFLGNCRHGIVTQNYIEPIPRPIVGGYLGTTRTYIGVDMSSRVITSIKNDVPNVNITISENTIYLPAGSYCNPGITAYGVQDGLFIEDNVIFNDGATSPATSILASTIFNNAGGAWTGPVGNPDFGAGGAVRMRSMRIENNLELGAGWASNEGNISVVVAVGGASADILGPGMVDRNTAGSYAVSNEPIVFGEHNRALPSSSAPYQAVSAICLYRNVRWTAPLTSAQQLEGTHHPVGGAAAVIQDAYGLDFIAQADGSLRGVLLTLAAAMSAGNYCTVRIIKDGSQLGVDTVTTSLVSGSNSFRYIVNFAGTAMTFAKGDKVQLQLFFDPAQVVAVTGKAEMLTLYV